MMTKIIMNISLLLLLTTFTASEVCYDHYGCFQGFPNTMYLPGSPDEMNVRFLLNNPENTDFSNPDYLDPLDPNKLTSSRFNPARKVVVIVHGFKDTFVMNEWMMEMAQKLIEVDNVNVICVDWKSGADAMYGKATANTRLVGRMIAKLLEQIHLQFNVAYSSMHIVGHSLGSHISGYAGSALGGQVGKISGLDPAGLHFENFDPEVRLDPEDAVFVQAMHTDADAVIQLGWGMGKAIADVDFYPNGGENQPGCDKSVYSFVTSLFNGDINEQVACCHLRALEFFTASISDCGFEGRLCGSYTDYNGGKCNQAPICNMGYWASSSCVSGQYYLKTTATKPYC